MKLIFSSDGMGITHKHYKQMIEIGVDVVTLGNHTWAKKDVFTFINEEERLIRPANYTEGVLGKGYVLLWMFILYTIISYNKRGMIKIS